MLTCFFEDNGKALLRHVTMTGIAVSGHKILGIKRAKHLLEGDKYALPGGFLGRDENTKEAIKREIKEETGYDCETGELFRFNDDPNRPNEDRQNVDCAYLIDIKDKIGEHDEEVQEVIWLDLDNLPPVEKWAFDHYELVMLFLKYQKQKFLLPIMG